MGACASYASTGRITPSLMAQLAMAWSWVPLVQFLIARAVAGRRGDVMLVSTHTPWSLWLVTASAMTGTFGFTAYGWMLLLALVPIAITPWLICRWFVQSSGADRRAAIRRTLMQQALTWLVAALYLDRAVSLWPRIVGWLS